MSAFLLVCVLFVLRWVSAVSFCSYCFTASPLLHHHYSCCIYPIAATPAVSTLSSLLLLYLLYSHCSYCIYSTLTTPTASALPPLILHLSHTLSLPSTVSPYASPSHLPHASPSHLPPRTTLGHSSDSPRSSPQDPLHLSVRQPGCMLRVLCPRKPVH